MRKAKPEKLVEKIEKSASAPVPAPNASPLRRGRGRPRRAVPPAPLLRASALVDAQQSLGSIKGRAGLDITEKVKDLIRLAKEQGHLTYDDVNDALPDELVTPEDLDQVHTKLRALEIDIIDPAEVDLGRPAEGADEEETVRFDILDDPVRMYLR